MPSLILYLALLPGFQKETADDAAETEAFQTYAKQSAEQYDIRVGRGGERQLVLRDHSVLRWTNPVGGRRAHGEVFLWTDRGRPAAVLSLYRLTEGNVVLEDHEFCSLALGGLSARRSGRPVWSPDQSAVELKPFPEAPAPQDSPRLRLTKMRRLAGQLRANKSTRENVTRDLRLLSDPVYRYESDDPTVLDGALFVFVEGTDPEVFLLIEARAGANEERKWMYGLGRMNSVRLRVLQGADVLWEAPALTMSDVHDRPDKPYTALRIR